MKPTAPLIPIQGERGCVGHLLRSARGFRAFDADDKEIGIYPTVGDGLVALLERGKPANADLAVVHTVHSFELPNNLDEKVCRLVVALRL
jgi:hypothetical protein